MGLEQFAVVVELCRDCLGSWWGMRLENRRCRTRGVGAVVAGTALVASLSITGVEAQTYNPNNPSKEYIRLGGQVIAIENAVQSAAPTVSIVSPSANSTITGTPITFEINAAAASPATLTTVQLFLDGVILGGASAASGSGWNYLVLWNSTTSDNGIHTFTAVATDSAGKSTTSAALPIIVFNGTPTTFATFNTPDTTTVGNWTGHYGANGQIIAAETANPPSYATVTTTGASVYTWTTSTTDARALQQTAGSTARIASTFYNTTPFTFDVNLTDGNVHKISLYLCDWDNGSRIERVTIVNPATGAILSLQTFVMFSGGVYESWNIQGHVQIQVTYIGGTNAVVNALFFDPIAAAPTATLSTTSLTFPNEPLGGSAIQTVTLTNKGTVPLTVSSINITGDFSSVYCGTVAPGSSCNTAVYFSPSATGTRTGTLTLVDNAPEEVQTIALSGTAVAAPTNMTTYLAPYGGSAPTFHGNSTVLPIRGYYPGGASQFGYIVVYLNAGTTTEYVIYAQSNGSGGYTLRILNGAQTTYAPPYPYLTMTQSGSNDNFITISPAITLNAVQITGYRFNLLGNEFQLDLQLTRSGTFSDQVVINGVNGNNYSSPWTVSDGVWSNP